MEHYRFYRLLDQRPGVFLNCRQVVKVLSGWAFLGLLFWAAIYELVKW